jgi:hypothetical protein
VSGALPYRLPLAGHGKLALGYDGQTKQRANFYRASICIRSMARAAPGPQKTSSRRTHSMAGRAPVRRGGHARHRQLHGEPARRRRVRECRRRLGQRLRGTFGVRFESAHQDVQCFDLFDPQRITQQGSLDNDDWLPTANLTGPGRRR